MPHHTRPAFTIPELLVVIFIIAVLVALLIPSTSHSREGRFASCGASLTGIVKALNLYGAENNDDYPVTLGTSVPKSDYATTSGKLPDAELTIKSIYNDGVPAAVGDPYACLWICVLKGTVSPKSFICKADPGSPQAMQIADSSGRFYQDFAPAFTVPGGPPVASYGFAYPWAKQGTTPTFNVAGYWHNTADSSIPIASDAGSGTRSASAPSAKLGNSLNHNGEGQNVAFADAHVEFQKTPLVGQGGENIFDVYPTDTVTTFDRTPNYSSNRTPIDVVGKAGAWLTTMVPQRTAAAGSAW